MEKRIRLLSRAMFFLDVFLALMTIISSSVLVRTSFGRASLAFGFVMLAVTVVLKVFRKW